MDTIKTDIDFEARKRGGEYDVAGNEYRNVIASLLSFNLLFLADSAYVSIEKQGDDLRFYDGIYSFYLECKRNAPGIGSWTKSSLASKGIFQYFVERYTENVDKKSRNFKIGLVSSDGSSFLHNLCLQGKRKSISTKDFPSLTKTMGLPENLTLDFNDFFSHIELCTYSEGTFNLLSEPLYKNAVDEKMISDIKNFIFTYGFTHGDITKKLLKEKVDSVNLWLIKNDRVIQQARDVVSNVRFFRKSLSINQVKDRLKYLLSIKDNSGEFTQKIREALNFYDTNIKIILGIVFLFKNDESLFKTDYSRSFLESIKGNPIYLWYFFKDLSKSKKDWYPLIKEVLFDEILAQEENYPVQPLFIEYLASQLDERIDDVLTTYIAILNKLTNERAQRKLVESLKDVKTNNSVLWEILSIGALLESSLVREETAVTLQAIAQLDLENAFNVFTQLSLKNAIPSDLVTGGLLMTFKFQGRDLENHVFNEAMKALELFMKLYPEKSLKFASEQLIIALEKKEVPGSEIISDYSYIWYSRADISNRNHEYDKKERLALEIEYAINFHLQSPSDKVSKWLERILENNYEIFYLVVLKQIVNVAGFKNLKRKLIFDKRLWKKHEIRQGYLQELIQKYFSQNPTETIEFLDLVNQLPADEKVDLLIKKELLEPLSLYPDLPKPMGIVATDWKREEINLSAYSVDDVYKIVTLHFEALLKIDHWTLRGNLAVYGSSNPKSAVELLKKLSRNISVSSELVGELVDGILEGYKANIVSTLEIAGLLRTEDHWAKLSLARYFEDKCKELNKVPSYLHSKILNCLTVLSSDSSPPPTDNIEQEKYSLHLVNEGINSVRGIVAEAAIYFLHYKPRSKKALLLLNKAMTDPVMSVRATAIFCFKYIVHDSTLYDFVMKSINEYKKIRISGIDAAILEVILHLGKEHLLENRNWIDLLAQSGNEEILERLGEMVAVRFLSGIPFDDEMDRILIKKEFKKEVRRGAAYQIEKEYPRLASGELLVNKNEVIKYLKALFDIRVEDSLEVRERIAFVFHRDDTPENEIEYFYTEGIFELVGRDINNVSMHHSTLDFIKRCLENHRLTSLRALIQVINKDTLALKDRLLSAEISEILKSAFENDLPPELRVSLEKILDWLVENGWENSADLLYSSFQDLYEKHL